MLLFSIIIEAAVYLKHLILLLLASSSSLSASIDSIKANVTKKEYHIFVTFGSSLEQIFRPIEVIKPLFS